MTINQSSGEQKKIFVVLGMPRGGTSAISRGLKALGVDLGNKLTLPNHEWNPKGFWEDNEIVYKVNARVLASLNRSWESLRWLEADTKSSDTLNPLKKFAAKLLQQRFSNTSFWGFKDPNTAKILPFWQAVFDHLHLADHYVIALRNPLSSAQSYHKLTGIDIEHGLFLWLSHMLAAIENTQNKKRVVVSYDLLMQKPRLQLDRMKQAFSLAGPMDEREINYYVNEFIDSKLHHYQDGYEDLLIHPAMAVSPLCLKLYNSLIRLAKDEIAFTDDAFASAWLEIKNDYKKMSSVYFYIDTLLQRNLAFKKSLHTLHKSRLWKIIYPLRKIDGALRARRKRLKQKKVAVLYES